MTFIQMGLGLGLGLGARARATARARARYSENLLIQHISLLLNEGATVILYNIMVIAGKLAVSSRKFCETPLICETESSEIATCMPCSYCICWLKSWYNYNAVGKVGGSA